MRCPSCGFNNQDWLERCARCDLDLAAAPAAQASTARNVQSDNHIDSGDIRKEQRPSSFLIIKEPPFPASYDKDTYLARTLEEMHPSYSYAEYKSQVRFLVRRLPASPDELNSLITHDFPDADLKKTKIQSFEDTNGGRGVRVTIYKAKTIGAEAEVSTKEDSNEELNSRLIEACDLDEVKMLMAKGADVNAKDSNGKTTLMNAAYYGRKEIVKFLLEHGADVNARYVDGCTALLWAAGEGKAEVVEILLRSGVDVYATERHNHTALMIANRMKRSSTAALLAEWEKTQQLKSAKAACVPGATSSAGRPSRPGSNKVPHVKVVAILMIIQGSLAILLGLVYVMGPVLLAGLSSTRSGAEAPMSSGDTTLRSVVIISMGIMGLIAGIPLLIAGIKNLKYRSRVFGIIALSVSVLAICTCYFAPTAIALLIYGLNIYLNEEVKAAFASGEQGLSPGRIKTQPSTQKSVQPQLRAGKSTTTQNKPLKAEVDPADRLDGGPGELPPVSRMHKLTDNLRDVLERLPRIDTHEWIRTVGPKFGPVNPQSLPGTDRLVDWQWLIDLRDKYREHFEFIWARIPEAVIIEKHGKTSYYKGYCADTLVERMVIVKNMDGRLWRFLTWVA